MFLMATRDIVFDLDGTLIDSAPSILASMQAAFDGVGLVPCAALTPALIGPPLVQTLRALLPEGAGEQALPALVEGFKRHYDAIGYQQTTVYPGVQDMLQALVHMPLRLHIATNKRIAPTRRIVEHLGWGVCLPAFMRWTRTPQHWYTRRPCCSTFAMC
jgi:phosphoglycolate phosphatase